jgi:hypothetical protein
MEGSADLGKIFLRANPFDNEDVSLINHFRVGMAVASP